MNGLEYRGLQKALRVLANLKRAEQCYGYTADRAAVLRLLSNHDAPKILASAALQEGDQL
jgi:hypothetical protein